MGGQDSKKTLKFIGIYYAILTGWLATTAMHIPDGYLSPVTSLIMFLLALPFWAVGLRRIRQTLDARSVPLIALVAAFSFVIMMFNVPLPGGTSGHAIGAALAAIILGPEVATIAISIALIIQAFFFGDGGILAIGANSFNMAIVIPYIAFGIYSAFSKGTLVTSRRRLAGAAVGAWVGVTAGAFFAGVEFGLQPLLFKNAQGVPLYAPYPLSVAIPAMVVPHMLVAAVVEAILTALVIGYLQRYNAKILENSVSPAGASEAGAPYRLRWIWVTLTALVLITPLGLLAPGTAWGEWSTQELGRLGMQSVPAGMAKLAGVWGAPLAHYNVPALGNTSLGYVLSALVGVLIVVVIAWLFTRLLATGRSPGK